MKHQLFGKILKKEQTYQINMFLKYEIHYLGHPFQIIRNLAKIANILHQIGIWCKLITK